MIVMVCGLPSSILLLTRFVDFVIVARLKEFSRGLACPCEIFPSCRRQSVAGEICV